MPFKQQLFIAFFVWLGAVVAVLPVAGGSTGRTGVFFFAGCCIGGFVGARISDAIFPG
jgi:hypothetical protein